MGASASGKSTLENQLLESDDVCRIISTTTRDMRSGEVADVNYHFITFREFIELDNDDQFIQTTSFANNFYGTTKSEYTSSHPIAVFSITPNSAVSFLPVLREAFPEFDIKLVFFNISQSQLRENMLARGDGEAAIALRVTHDDLNEQFMKSGLVADFIIRDNDLSDSLAVNVREQLNLNGK